MSKPVVFLRKLVGEFKSVSKSVLYEWKDKNVYNKKPAKPGVINMQANDICNSKCVMCNIWKQKQDFEFSPKDLESILKDDLYSEVTSVGITGGEPTLREDLPELYEVVCKTLPSFRGGSIITNAIRHNDVIKRIEACHEVLKKYGKRFVIMVSIDGYGEVHDRNRNREGNFESAMKVVNHIRYNMKLPVTIGCTITKQNVWDVDELLDFVIEENLPTRFRVAEYINRLYNDDLTDSIRNFSEEEKYHLASFYQRLLCNYEKDPTYQRTYQSIISILTGGERTIGCPYHNRGIVMGSRGELQYCSPKSKVIGNGLEESSLKLYESNTDERKRLRTSDCSDCIHDYHAQISTKEIKKKYTEYFYDRAYNLKFVGTIGRLNSLRISKKSFSAKTILITGWYGTETVGDKAILAGIMDFYEKQFDKVDFIISSIYPFHTERTLVELDKKARVVSTRHPAFIEAAKSADITVMGGGPLMELEALAIPKTAFQTAKSAGKKTVVFGCGIGPLYKAKYTNAVKDILRLSDEIKLRDTASIALGKTMVKGKEFEFFGDPAYHYVKKIAENYRQKEKKNVLACFLREWPKGYRGELSEAEFADKAKIFENNLARSIKEFCKEFNLIPHFYCMHTFVVGGDDRKFYRRFIKEHFSDIEHYMEKRPSSVDQIVRAMSESSYNLCMRFHSVLFAHTLETNFLAIDYTMGGKIKGFLTDNNGLDKLISPMTLIEDASFSLAAKVSNLNKL